MAHVASKGYLLLSRRLLAVMAEKVTPQAVSSGAASASKNATRMNVGVRSATESTGSGKKDIFWMRDPKTGCWKPESHFDEVDPAELRHRLLRTKH